MRQMPVWYFNTTEFWSSYPHKSQTANMKTYYLIQFAYWLQQFMVLVLQLEKPRKDYYELIVHHIVTLVLIGLSYRFHFTYVCSLFDVYHSTFAQMDWFMRLCHYGYIRHLASIVKMCKLPRFFIDRANLYRIHRCLVLH